MDCGCGPAAVSTHSADAPEAVYHQIKVPGPREELGPNQAPGGRCLVSWLASWAGPLGLAHRKRSSLIVLPEEAFSDMEVFHKTTAGGYSRERRTESSGKYWTLGTDNGGLSSRSGLHLDLGSHGVLDNDCPGNPGWGWLPPGQLCGFIVDRSYQKRHCC